MITYWLVDKVTNRVIEVSADDSDEVLMQVEVDGVMRDCDGPYWTPQQAVGFAFGFAPGASEERIAKWQILEDKRVAREERRQKGVDCKVHGHVKGIFCGKCAHAKGEATRKSTKKKNQDSGYWVFPLGANYRTMPLRFITRANTSKTGTAWCSYEDRLALEAHVSTPEMKLLIKEAMKEKEREDSAAMYLRHMEAWEKTPEGKQRKIEREREDARLAREEARRIARLTVPVSGPKIDNHSIGGGLVRPKQVPWMSNDDNWSDE